MPKFSGVIPILSVTDVMRSITYYVERLGFRKHWDWGSPPTFGAVKKDSIEIFFCQFTQGKPGTWMFISVDDVDALHEEFKKTGATIRQPPTNFPWGHREMNVEDPDGHRLRFASDATGAADGIPLMED